MINRENNWKGVNMSRYNNPWKIEFIDETVYSSHFDILDSAKNVIVSFIPTQEQAELIAAAPELLEAAKLAHKKFKKQREIYEKFHVQKIGSGETEIKLEEVINKAKGDGD